MFEHYCTVGLAEICFWSSVVEPQAATNNKEVLKTIKWLVITVSVKFSDYFYFVRYYDLFDFTLVY